MSIRIDKSVKSPLKNSKFRDFNFILNETLKQK